jgi:F-type H+-transporting ATPase subunit c
VYVSFREKNSKRHEFQENTERRLDKKINVNLFGGHMKSLKYLALLAVAVLAFANPAFAAEGAAPLFGDGLAAGLAIGIAALGGALGQGRATSSALDAIGRNPGAANQLFNPMIIGLVLIESLVIYALVIAAKLAGLF